MEEFIEKKTFKLKTLTPLHISDGAEGEIIPTEYVISDDKILHKINLPRFISLMPESRKIQLDNHLENEDFIALRRLIQTCWQESSKTYTACMEYSTKAGDLCSYYAQMDTGHEESLLQLTPFIRSSGKLLLPGSSVKGAFRTALINSFFPDDGINIPLDVPPNNKREQNKNNDRNAKKLEAEKLQYREPSKKDPKKLTNNIGKDPLKCLKISDTFIQGNNISTIRKIQNIRLDDDNSETKPNQEKDIKLFGEFIDQDVEINIGLSLDTRYFKKVKLKIGKRFSLNDITASCKKFYDMLLSHEKKNYFDTFEKQTGDSTVSDLYDELIEMNKTENSFVMRLGRYGGRNSISFNIRNKQGKEPKSRNLVLKDGKYWPTGWIFVTE